MITIRAAEPGDNAVLLAMNNDAVPAVNPHDEDSWLALLEIAGKAWVAVDDVGAIGGLLVTFGPDDPYASRNYGWLKGRYDNFGYVDRIIAAPTHRRMGIAGSLYDTFVDYGRSIGWERLTCEVNVEPPNPQSIAYHEAQGWTGIEDVTHEPGYTVRFFEKLL